MPTNFPPVGDIKISKLKNSYNTYKLELSYGQIVTIQKALQAVHDDAIADELLAMFNYYTTELPGPGEDEEDADARKEAVAGADGQGDENDEFPVPMPPGQETAMPDDSDIPELPRGDEDAAEAPSPDEMDAGREVLNAATGDPSDDEQMDDLLPKPPVE